MIGNPSINAIQYTRATIAVGEALDQILSQIDTGAQSVEVKMAVDLIHEAAGLTENPTQRAELSKLSIKLLMHRAGDLDVRSLHHAISDFLSDEHVAP